MRIRGLLGLAALFAVCCSVGCSSMNPTIRGQGPELNGPIVGSAPGYGDIKRSPYLGKNGAHDFRAYNGFRDNNFGYEGGYYAGPEGYYTSHDRAYTAGDGCQDNGSGCPYCQGGRTCPNGRCHACGGCFKNGFPYNYQTYKVDYPQNMVYPQQGVPSGVIQYPYYTLRGPTDFFMDKNQ